MLYLTRNEQKTKSIILTIYFHQCFLHGIFKTQRLNIILSFHSQVSNAGILVVGCRQGSRQVEGILW